MTDYFSVEQNKEKQKSFQSDIIHIMWRSTVLEAK